MSSQLYTTYAPIYDAIGQGQFSARMAAWALAWLAERGVHPARILDLACGTGEAALVFAAAGCEVIGVDLSAAMLEIARGKARDAGYNIEYIHGDMRDLEPRTKNQEPQPALPLDKLGNREVEKSRRTKHQASSIKNYGHLTTDNGHFQFSIFNSQFDVVTCFYDSLNYLTGERDLDQVCVGVARALRPGGVMVFDMNTAAEYATWDERDCVTYDGRDCLVYNQLSYDPDAGLATGRIVWFVRELDRWWRGEETHTERAWSDDAVRAALCGAELELIGRYDTVGDVATGEALRVVYVARRADRAPDSKARCER